MPQRCCLPGCGNTSESHSLFSFPTSDQQRWLDFYNSSVSSGDFALRKRYRTEVSPYLRICEVHFSEDCLLLRSRDPGSARRKLKPGSVPTILPAAVSSRVATQSLLRRVTAGPSASGTVAAGPSASGTIAAGPSAAAAGRVTAGPSAAAGRSGRVAAVPSAASGRVAAGPSAAARIAGTVAAGPSAAAAAEGAFPGPSSSSSSCPPNIPDKTQLTDLPQLSEEDTFVDSYLTEYAHDPLDPSYVCSSMYTESESSETESEAESIDHKFVLVDVNILLELLSRCTLCGQIALRDRSILYHGSMMKVTQYCVSCSKDVVWKSQKQIGHYAEGNIAMSAAIMFTGSCPTKSTRMLETAGLKGFTSQAYFNIQTSFLIPAVNREWEQERMAALEESEDGLIVAGDARNDSMGHCAKYGTYSLLSLATNKIVAIETVQVTEVSNSNAMELEGFRRCFTSLQNSHKQIDTIVTDRHKQINAVLRKDHGQITHFFDVWHIAKGLRKKLKELAKKRGCEEVKDWVHSLINHLYWVARTSNGSADLMEAKWRSAVNHIAGVHEHDNPLFPRCLHAESERGWLEADSEAYERISEILLTRYVLHDVRKMSPLGQTYSLEAFHSLINQFSPKMFHFKYNTMIARTRLAALHYNENSRRNVIKDKEGNPKYNVVFPKPKGGDYTLRPKKEEATYKYATKLRDVVYKMARGEIEVVPLPEPPPSMASRYERPNVQEAAATRIERFQKYPLA